MDQYGWHHCSHNTNLSVDVLLSSVFTCEPDLKNSSTWANNLFLTRGGHSTYFWLRCPKTWRCWFSFTLLHTQPLFTRVQNIQLQICWYNCKITDLLAEGGHPYDQTWSLLLINCGLHRNSVTEHTVPLNCAPPGYIVIAYMSTEVSQNDGSHQVEHPTLGLQEARPLPDQRFQGTLLSTGRNTNVLVASQGDTGI